MAVERYGSKTDVVVKLVLVFFVCLLSFSIGTFVGKKFSDNQHKIAKFEPEAAERSVASEGDEKSRAAMSDEEFAKLAEEFVADDEKQAGNETAKDRAPAKADEHAKDAMVKPATADKPDAKSPPMKVAEKVALNQKPEVKAAAAATTEERIPKSLPVEIGASAIGKYTVQVGSYANEEEAKKRTEAFKEQTFSAFYVEANINGKSWYRVSLGLFNTQKDAENYMKDLLERKKVASAIVQKIKK